MRIRVALVLLLFVSLVPVWAAELVSPFAGSQPVGEYAADYVKYYYLPTAEDDVKPVAVEGRLESRIYKKPEEKSNFEVFKSFEKELQAAGFEMVSVMDKSSRVEILVRDANSPDKNGMGDRKYMSGDLRTPMHEVALAATQAQHYIAARKTIDKTDVLVVVYTSRAGNYTIEQLESAAMEEGTVVLSLGALTDQMANEGRIALYGIHFDSGSATIKPESAETLDIIVQYLRNHPDRSFYVVGHTDDQGAFASNMELSQARAEAVVAALLQEIPGSSDNLQAGGVGPLSPVATNTGTDGRALNRRVELVSRLE